MINNEPAIRVLMCYVEKIMKNTQQAIHLFKHYDILLLKVLSENFALFLPVITSIAPLTKQSMHPSSNARGDSMITNAC